MEALIDAFPDHSPGIVVAMKRYGEEPVQSADYEIGPDPEDLLKLLAQVTSSEHGTLHQAASLPRSA